MENKTAVVYFGRLASIQWTLTEEFLYWEYWVFLGLVYQECLAPFWISLQFLNLCITRSIGGWCEKACRHGNWMANCRWVQFPSPFPREADCHSRLPWQRKVRDALVCLCDIHQQSRRPSFVLADSVHRSSKPVSSTGTCSQSATSVPGPIVQVGLRWIEVLIESLP